MKTTDTIFPELSQWVNTGWALLTGRSPESPPKELPPKAAQAAANQAWEDEGGSVIKPPKKPVTKEVPKIPR
jgi:hypothetical protein